ncbi:hypothetical protein K502DRAFT_350204 [Neoconidiobolus thromboides FSU 785]|nr:hypothetical protein K502DRAFT_350204 [Neoconidiobolus thromboides FSU 785]
MSQSGFFAFLSIATIALIAITILLNAFLIYFICRVPCANSSNNKYDLFCCKEGKLTRYWVGLPNPWFFTTAAYYYEIQLSVSLAIERICKVLDIKLSKYIRPVVHINGLIYTVLMILCGSQHLMEASSSKLICIYPVVYSIIGSIAYYYLLSTFTIGISVISYCYYRLAKDITDMKNFVEIKISPNPSKLKDDKLSSYKLISIKLYTILIIYSTCMFGSILLYFFAGIFQYVYGEVNVTILVMNQLAETLFLIGILANSGLLLVLHRGIANEAKKVYTYIKCW